MGRNDIKNQLRKVLRSRGIEVGGYRHTVHSRRARMLASHGVDLLVDVGANVGQYATEVRDAGYRGHILSVEPVRAAYEQLSSMADGATAWTALHSALGAEEGVVTMNVSEGSIFSSPKTVMEHTQRASPNSRVVATEQSPVVTLDSLVEGDDRTLGVKIDVQGYEREVLAGGQDALARAVMVELELSPQPVYEGQMLMMETLEHLAEAGFVLRLVENLFPDPDTGGSLQFNGIFARSTGAAG